MLTRVTPSLGSQRTRQVDNPALRVGSRARHHRHHQEEHRRQREDRWVRWAHLEEQCCEKSREHHRACEPNMIYWHVLNRGGPWR